VVKSLYAKVPLHGAVVVTTPSALAAADVVRGVRMLQRFQVPVLALVDNMASFTCSSCSQLHYPFGHGHLGSVQAALRESSDENSSGLAGDVPVTVPTFRLPIVPAVSETDGDGRRGVVGKIGGANSAEVIDALVESLEVTAGSTAVEAEARPPVSLPHGLAFHERPHWPTIMSMAEVTTC
jgi:Mrp family chromosome partitioning ATPase